MSPQVCSVLESLEQEYKREEDWCGGADKLGPNSETDHVTPMISKHLEQKEAFLKVTYDRIKTNPNIVLSYISDLCVCVCVDIFIRHALWPEETQTSSSSTCTGTASTCLGC